MKKKNINETTIMKDYEALKAHAEACESTLAALQEIFVVRYIPEKGDLSIEVKKGALNSDDLDLTRRNMGLLIGLFGDDSLPVGAEAQRKAAAAAEANHESENK